MTFACNNKGSKNHVCCDYVERSSEQGTGSCPDFPEIAQRIDLNFRHEKTSAKCQRPVRGGKFGASSACAQCDLDKPDEPMYWMCWKLIHIWEWIAQIVCD